MTRDEAQADVALLRIHHKTDLRQLERIDEVLGWTTPPTANSRVERIRELLAIEAAAPTGQAVALAGDAMNGAQTQTGRNIWFDERQHGEACGVRAGGNCSCGHWENVLAIEAESRQPLVEQITIIDRHQRNRDHAYASDCDACNPLIAMLGNRIVVNSEETIALVVEQPPPRPASGDMWKSVIEDMETRRQFGIEQYGTPLQAHNGRDALVDSYQEALDLCVYLRQAIEERSHT